VRCDLAAARRLGEQGVQFARQHGDDRLLIESLRTLCAAYYLTGEPDRGLPFIRESVERARRLGDDVLLARSLVGCLQASYVMDPARCGQLFTEAIACTERSGDRLVNLFLHNNAGIYALGAGNLAAARAHLEQAAHAQRAIGAHSHHVSVNLGWVLRQESDPDGARSMLEAALRISRQSGNRIGLACASLGLACLAADRGDWHRAAELHGTAQAFLNLTGQQWEEPEARYRLESLEKIRERLGGEQFDRAYAKGPTLSLDVVIERAAFT
jgi:Tfp pilus assembly protein PilF